MDNIFERDRNGEVISPNEPGYELLIDDLFHVWKLLMSFLP